MEQGPKGWGWGEKVFLVMRDGTEMGKNKTMLSGHEDPKKIVLVVGKINKK